LAIVILGAGGPRYAEIVRTIFAKRDWIVPTVYGDLYTEAGADCIKICRRIGFVSATYFTGREVFSQKVGLIAGAVLATSVRVISETRWAHIDMLFGFFFLRTIYFGARSLLGTGGKREFFGRTLHGGGGSEQGANQPTGRVGFGSWRKLSFLSFAKAGRSRWSPRPFSMQVKSTVPATSPLYIYADRMNDFNFYSERQKFQCCLGLANWRKCANKPVPPICR
jgi:hypothetical protein